MSWFKSAPPFDLQTLSPRLRDLAVDIWDAGSSGITVLKLGAKEHLAISSSIRGLRRRGFEIHTRKVTVTDRRGNLRKGVTLVTMVSWPPLI